MPRSSRSGSGGRADAVAAGARGTARRPGWHRGRRSGTRTPSRAAGAPAPPAVRRQRRQLGVHQRASQACTVVRVVAPALLLAAALQLLAATRASRCSAKPSPASHSSWSCRKLPATAPRGKRVPGGADAGGAAHRPHEPRLRMARSTGTAALGVASAGAGTSSSRAAGRTHRPRQRGAPAP